MLKHSFTQESSPSRFLKEIEALGRLEHASIARVLAAGTLPKDGRPWFAMEYVEGKTLAEASAELSLAQRVDCIVRVADAVGHAHARGIVHRDIKPANILIAKEGGVRVLDFGIARFLDGHDGSALTANGQLLGTLPYMSPEQLRGERERVGKAADVYSLGVVAYELMTGQLPYSEASFDALVRRIATGNATRMRRLATELSSGLETVSNAPTPQPFSIALAFTTPYVHAVRSDLLLEIEVAPDPNRAATYFLDLEADRTKPGSIRRFGTQGRFRSQETLSLSSSPGALVPGGRVEYIFSRLQSGYPTVASFGFSKSRFGALSLPFDLSALGAPGNSLYSSIDLAFAAEVGRASRTFFARAILDIPNDARLGNLRLFSQLLFVDPASNGFGLVTSPGLDIVLGTNKERETQAIRASSLTSTRGDYLFRSNVGVGGYPVTELRGTFR